MGKRLLVVIFLFFSAFLFNLNSFADNSVGVVIDGNNVLYSVPVEIVNGKTMLPLRETMQKLGYNVFYNKNLQTITIYGLDNNNGDNTYIVMKVGCSTVLNTYQLIKIDENLKIINNISYIPARVLAKLFDANIEWNSEIKTVNLKFKEHSISKDVSLSKGFYTNTDAHFKISNLIDADMIDVGIQAVDSYTNTINGKLFLLRDNYRLFTQAIYDNNISGRYDIERAYKSAKKRYVYDRQDDLGKTEITDVMLDKQANRYSFTTISIKEYDGLPIVVKQKLVGIIANNNYYELGFFGTDAFFDNYYDILTEWINSFEAL